MTLNVIATEVSWSTHKDVLMALRLQVFVEEQGIALTDELDPNDASHRHFLAYDGSGQAVGCGRLTTDGQIGRMAVVQARRRQGVGATLLAHIVAAAEGHGAKYVFLHAQTDAKDFYAKHGFTATGDTFKEAGLQHLTMRRPLP